MNKYFVFIIILVFLLLGVGIYLLHIYAPLYRNDVLMVGNALMALLVATSYLIVRRQVHERPQAFVRGVYGASLLKLMVCMFALLVYVVVDRANIHKPSIFALMGIYVIYTTVETLSLSKMARERK